MKFVRSAYPKLVERFKLRPDRVNALIETLTSVAVVVLNVLERWKYDRDPDDAHYINLALAADAKLVVSRDRDLLDLMDLAKPEAAAFQRLFPSLRIIDPVSFLGEFRI